MGEYDIPAAIDLVLGETGSEKLYYIGHSMGTTMFWVALNEHPELKDKIALMIGMGPVAKVKNMKSPLRFIAPYVHEADVSRHVTTVMNKNRHSFVILCAIAAYYLILFQYFKYLFRLLGINQFAPSSELVQTFIR